VLNVLYFTAYFPLIFWIVHRHRDVLEDPDTLILQRQESIEMLEHLPIHFGHNRLMDEHHRLRTANVYNPEWHFRPDVYKQGV
jgi:hypothetical protein